jgi:hypothetical protein
MDRVVLIETLHDGHQVGLRGGRRQTLQPPVDPSLLTRSLFVANIHLAGRVIPHQDGNQARASVARCDELGDVGRHFLPNFGRHRFAIQDSSRHDNLPVLKNEETSPFSPPEPAWPIRLFRTILPTVCRSESTTGRFPKMICKAI